MGSEKLSPIHMYTSHKSPIHYLQQYCFFFVITGARGIARQNMQIDIGHFVSKLTYNTDNNIYCMD